MDLFDIAKIIHERLRAQTGHRGVPINTVARGERTIADQIGTALHLRKLCGQSLMQDREVCALLSRLNLHIEATQSAMVRAGIVKECADCAVNGEGTCCGVRTGYKCGSVLLLINLLLGRTLPPEPTDTHLCHFLTKQRRALRARPVLCVNFICQRLRDVLPHNSLCNVQDIAGGELNTLFVLEECIKKKIGAATLIRAQKQRDEKM
ncbi:MAG: hypothetical protein AB1390_03940 [Nitrospirota bacterium]